MSSSVFTFTGFYAPIIKSRFLAGTVNINDLAQANRHLLSNPKLNLADKFLFSLQSKEKKKKSVGLLCLVLDLTFRERSGSIADRTKYIIKSDWTRKKTIDES